MAYPFTQPTEAERAAIKAEKQAKAEAELSRIQETFKAGGVVVVATYTQATQYDKRHAEMFRAGTDGVYVRRGRKSWDFISCASIRHYRPTAKS